MDTLPKKYELLTSDTRTLGDGTVVYRIRALRDFWEVKAGQLGGYVQSEDNLSHEGKCWVVGEGMVIEQARVSGDAMVSNSLVFGHAQVSGWCVVFNDAQVGGHSVVTGAIGIVDGRMAAGNDVHVDWERRGKAPQ